MSILKGVAFQGRSLLAPLQNLTPIVVLQISLVLTLVLTLVLILVLIDPLFLALNGDT